jgi:PH domain/leucine-rich repeat-containing protein phosphatase
MFREVNGVNHLQYGGGTSRRLTATENPLLIQDGFLRQLGYCEISRRSRLGIDPELRHLIRFHVGKCGAAHSRTAIRKKCQGHIPY